MLSIQLIGVIQLAVIAVMVSKEQGLRLVKKVGLVLIEPQAAAHPIELFLPDLSVWMPEFFGDALQNVSALLLGQGQNALSMAIQRHGHICLEFIAQSQQLLTQGRHGVLPRLLPPRQFRKDGRHLTVIDRRQKRLQRSQWRRLQQTMQ